MLLRFQVTNHRSIHAPVELSMIAIDDERRAARSFPNFDDKVLAVAGIFGPNASGKSNVLDALDWLAAAVGSSLLSWGQGIPRTPFRFASGMQEPTRFEVDLLIEGIRYSYRLVVSNTSIDSESLAYYPHRRRNVLFDRTGTTVTLGRDIRSASGIRELTVASALVLSSAMRLDVEPVSRCARVLASIGSRLPTTRRPTTAEESTEWWLTSRQLSLFDSDQAPIGPGHESALRLLQAADLGISNAEIIFDGRSKRVRFTHSEGGEQLFFDEEEESIGTMVWFDLIGPVLAALRDGQILVIDELDASLHSAIAERVLEMFQSPLTNPNGAQLIFTSHDTSLLNRLNRDEVWFTEKVGGQTSLTALSEYRLRKDQRIEPSYVNGRFGAIPDVKDHLVLEALGVGG